ncbi:hypothetical protein TB2_001484 [Malus domestica]
MDALSSYLHSHHVKHGDERVCISQQAIASSGAILREDNPLDILSIFSDDGSNHPHRHHLSGALLFS